MSDENATGSTQRGEWGNVDTSDTDTGVISSKAVSDLVGFSLMFGIIIVSVGVVSVGGVDDILLFGEREEIQTSERGMEAAASSMEKINRQDDSFRSFDLVLGSGNLFYGESAITVTVDGEDHIYDVNHLTHQFDRGTRDVNVTYEAGGVFRSDHAFATFTPSVACRQDNHASISLIELTSDDIDIAVDFSNEFTIDPIDPPSEPPVASFAATASFDAELVNGEQIYEDNVGDEVTIDVSETVHPDQWQETLERQGWDVEEEHKLTCDVDSVLVRVNTVELTRGGF